MLWCMRITQTYSTTWREGHRQEKLIWLKYPCMWLAHCASIKILEYTKKTTYSTGIPYYTLVEQISLVPKTSYLQFIKIANDCIYKKVKTAEAKELHTM